MTTPPWQELLEECFPGYLLPDTDRSVLSVEAARRFIGRLSDRPDQLELLLETSFAVAHASAIERFVTAQLPALIRVLPSTTLIHRRVWEGGFAGRLDLRGTLAYRFSNRPTTFVTRSRRREFILPENVLVRVVADRLMTLSRRLVDAGVTKNESWGSAIDEAHTQLNQALNSTILKEVPPEPITGHHLHAARMATHPTYSVAAEWFERIRTDLETEDPARIAEVVSKGALRPLDAPTRFEIAVVIRLLQCLEQRLVPAGWTFERNLVLARRKDVATFRIGNRSLQVFYNQAILPPGQRDKAVAHYFGSAGRFRPDITLLSFDGDRQVGAQVVEVKLSDRVTYLGHGLGEALLYLREYRNHLSGWPKSMLVTSAAIEGHPRQADEAVAVDWRRWVPVEVLDGILSGLEAQQSSATASS